jgi:hypothetical protein
MKNSILTLAFCLTSGLSHAAIKCTGYNIRNQNEVLNLQVDGNPLTIWYKIAGAQNSGMTLLVNILEKGTIKAEARSDYGHSFGTHGELSQGSAGLPQGYNAKFTERVDPMGRLSTAKDKKEYILSCKGQVPAVYREYVR